MDHLSDILKKRAIPGILIFDQKGQLLYCNKEALEMLPELREPLQSGEEPNLPEEIHHLCNKIAGTHSEAQPEGGADAPLILRRNEGIFYTVRAFPLGMSGNKSAPTHSMVLIEGITEKRQVDFEKARKEFNLSRRETEVLQLVCQGLGNKEIAAKLFISEYTVKDHIKKIMDKLKTTSRSEIVALLK